jgi:hypothetical protein
MDMDTRKDEESDQATSTPPSLAIPPGYSVATGPDGRYYVVPTFLLPAVELAMATGQQKTSNVNQAVGGVSVM